MGHYDCKYCGDYGCFGECPEGQAAKERHLAKRRIEIAAKVEKAMTVFEGYRDSDGDIDCDSFEGDIKIIQEGDWTQEHKYQLQEVIVKYDGIYYQLWRTRSGSYHSDWFYGETTVQPVMEKKKQVIITSWEPLVI